MYSNGTSAYLNGTKVIGDGVWHIVVATRNGSTDKLCLYVDGVQDISMVQSFNSGFKSETADLNIGWLSASYNYTLNGSLDEWLFTIQFFPH